MRRALLIVFSVIFAISSSMVAYRMIQAHTAGEINDDAYELSGMNSFDESDEIIIEDEPLPLSAVPFTSDPISDTQELAWTPVIGTSLLPEDAKLLTEIDLEPLVDINDDVIGWIYIPNGDISHPLVHSKDNSEYLNHAWNGEQSTSGAIFMERRSSRDFCDFNTIIYGHNMRNNKFFAPLHKYADEGHREKSPYVYILTEDTIFQYEVFSAYKASVKSDTYRLVFDTEGMMEKALEYYVSSSSWDMDIDVTDSDRILTLSTCTRLGEDDYRWVVQAHLIGAWIK